MEKRRLLIVTQELDPYTALSEIASIVARMPKIMIDNDFELRIMMPRYGTINERRHRLHEVVRLTGINIIVDEDDYPLTIKVASLPGFRLQVYFLDNDDFFARKSVVDDEDGKPFEDNADRAIFFSKGVIETVKKFGWAPDIIHCHGWMTSLVPFYLRTAYKIEPLFDQSCIVYSVYESDAANLYQERFMEKAAMVNMDKDVLNAFVDADGFSMHKGACAYADAIIIGSESVDSSVEYLSGSDDKPVLQWQEEASCMPSYLEFFQSLLEEKVSQ